MNAIGNCKLDQLSPQSVILEGIHFGKPEGLCESVDRGKVLI